MPSPACGGSFNWSNDGAINRWQAAETAIDWTFRVEWGGDTPQPGQFFQVSVPRIGEAPISTCGWGDGWIELTVRNVGRVTGAIFGMEPGTVLHLRGPYGHPFPVAEFANRHTIIAAGGTGLAPVRRLIEGLAAKLGKADGPFALILLVGFKSPADMLFTADLEDWSRQAAVLLTVDRTAPGWNGRVGVVTTLIPELTIPSLDDVRVVVVGPPLMMKGSIGKSVGKVFKRFECTRAGTSTGNAASSYGFGLVHLLVHANPAAKFRSYDAINPLHIKKQRHPYKPTNQA